VPPAVRSALSPTVTTFSGRVASCATGAPVSGARIGVLHGALAPGQVRAIDASTQYGRAPDEEEMLTSFSDGSFNTNHVGWGSAAGGARTLRVSYPGLATQIVQVRPNAPVAICF
jgi:hypothetical protein